MIISGLGWVVCYWYLGTWYLVSGEMVFGIWYLGTWYLVYGIYSKSNI